MKIPTWGTMRDPLCWMLGAGTFGFLVATNNPSPVFVGAAVAIMGIPGAVGLDDIRRQRRENKSSNGPTNTLLKSSGRDSLPSTLLPPSSSGDD